MEMTTVSIQIEKDLKERAEDFFGNMGMDLSMAVSAFFQEHMPQPAAQADYWFDERYISEEEFNSVVVAYENSLKNPDDWISVEELMAKARGRIYDKIQNKVAAGV
ncbi:MAG: hypothetical protein LBE35_11175 [Clostridiales bacterium]|jgi:antitoxin component of RelBE/YafQ-DinJ toxin-antitoxin module|nr:hypothetical protein [Clostridiales bacterium]